MPKKRRARSAPRKRRILIVDPVPLARRGLRTLIEAEPDMTVCGEASHPRDGLAAILETQPDLVILDLPLGSDDGLDLVRAIRLLRPNALVLVLTMQEMARQVRLAFAAGANGHASKRESSETLLLALRSLFRGETFGAPEN